MTRNGEKEEEMREFEAMLEKIMECGDACFDDDVSADTLQVEFSDVENEWEPSDEMHSDSVDCPDFGHTGQRCTNQYLMEESGDFPIDNEDSELHYAAEQIKELNITERPEYNDSKHILKVGNVIKKKTKRCENLDEQRR